MISNRKKNSKNKTKKINLFNKTNVGKKWVTAIQAANHTLETTKSLKAAKESLRRQALYNARKLFGNI